MLIPASAPVPLLSYLGAAGRVFESDPVTFNELWALARHVRNGDYQGPVGTLPPDVGDLWEPGCDPELKLLSPSPEVFHVAGVATVVDSCPFGVEPLAVDVVGLVERPLTVALEAWFDAHPGEVCVLPSDPLAVVAGVTVSPVCVPFFCGDLVVSPFVSGRWALRPVGLWLGDVVAGGWFDAGRNERRRLVERPFVFVFVDPAR